MEKLATFMESSQDLFYEALMTAPGTIVWGTITASAFGIKTHEYTPEVRAACREKAVNPSLKVTYQYSPDQGIFMPQYGEERPRWYNKFLDEETTSGSLDLLLKPGKPAGLTVDLCGAEFQEKGVQSEHITTSLLLQKKFLPYLKSQGYEITRGASVCLMGEGPVGCKLEIWNHYVKGCLDIYDDGIASAFRSKVADWLTPLKEKYK